MYFALIKKQKAGNKKKNIQASQVGLAFKIKFMQLGGEGSREDLGGGK